MPKINIAQAYRKIKGSFAAIGTNPYTDWKIVFIFSFFLMIASMVFGVYLFNQINRGQLFDVEKKRPGAVTTVDRNALKNIIQTFNDKEAAFIRLQQEKERYEDPSI